MDHWAIRALSTVAALGLGTLAAALLASIPVLGWLALTVLVKRQSVPLIYNLRSLGKRRVTTAATLGGLALVVFVLTAVLMMGFGIQQTMVSSGEPLNVKLLLRNSPAEVVSFIKPEQVRALWALPEVAQTPAGEPMVSPELVTLAWVQRKGSTDPDAGANITVRGVPLLAFDLHPMKHLEGRRFRPGLNELVIGKALVGRFEGAELGGTMRFGSSEWKVVGIADRGGNAQESEAWGDFRYLSSVLRRPCSSVTATLKEQSSFMNFARRVAADPTLGPLEVEHESDYWGALSKRHVHFVTIVGVFVAVIFSFAAILGAMNTLHAQVTARMSELGTLRAIGFRPRAILTSLVFEAVLMSFASGVVGVAAASLLERLKFQSTLVETLSEITYQFLLSPRIALLGIGFACAMGYAGSLLPALKAARTPLVNVIRGE
jgi:ABC-type lipoprotein release transport system permease subunit